MANKVVQSKVIRGFGKRKSPAFNKPFDRVMCVNGRIVWFSTTGKTARVLGT